MVQTTRTTTVHGQTAVVRTTTHDLSICGKAGIAMFLLLATFVTFIIAFSTAGWVGNLDSHYGLWEGCSRFNRASYYHYNDDFHVAVQVLMCIALVGLVISVIMIFLYLFVSGVSRYRLLLGLVITIFITFALLFISIVVFGAKVSEYNGRLFWSYGVACISTILCLIAGIFAAIQLKNC